MRESNRRGREVTKEKTAYFLILLTVSECAIEPYRYYPPLKPALHICLAGDCKNGYGQEEILSNGGEYWAGRPSRREIYEGYFRNGIANGTGIRFSGPYKKQIHTGKKFIEREEWDSIETGEFLDGELHGYALYRTGRYGSHLFHQRRKGEVSNCHDCDIYIHLDRGKCVPGKIRLVLRKTGEDYHGYTDCRTGFCIEGNCTDGVGKKLTWDNDFVLEGEFKDGYLYGKGRSRHKNWWTESDYEGEFVDGSPNGWGKIIYKTKAKNKEKFKNDWSTETVITEVYEGPVKSGREAGRGRWSFLSWPPRVTEDQFYNEDERKKIRYKRSVEAEFKSFYIKPGPIKVTEYDSGLILEDDRWSESTVLGGYLIGKVTVRNLDGKFIKECIIKQYKQLCDD